MYDPDWRHNVVETLWYLPIDFPPLVADLSYACWPTGSVHTVGLNPTTMCKRETQRSGSITELLNFPKKRKLQGI